MGQLISEIGIRGIAPIYFDASFKGSVPGAITVTMEDLEEIYPAASAACKADPAAAGCGKARHGGIAGRAPRATRAMAAFRGGVGSRRQARISMPWMCISTLKGEASVHDRIAPMIADFKARGWRRWTRARW